MLMNTMRSRATRMHSRRFRLVRRSSSMTPTFRVFLSRPRTSSIAVEEFAGERRFLGAVHFRLDDVDTARPAIAVLAQSS